MTDTGNDDTATYHTMQPVPLDLPPTERSNLAGPAVIGNRAARPRLNVNQTLKSQSDTKSAVPVSAGVNGYLNRHDDAGRPRVELGKSSPQRNESQLLGQQKPDTRKPSDLAVKCQ